LPPNFESRPVTEALESRKRRKLSEEESERLVVQYAPLVKAIAQSLLRKLPPSVQLDELMQDGYIGLMGALLHATMENAGGQFQSYLSQRVRGAMLDGLRENDPGTRKVRREMRRVEQAIHALGHELGRSPSETEVATRLEMPLENYQQLLQQAHGYSLFSLDDFEDIDDSKHFIDWCASTNSDPLAALERKVLQRQLLMAISELAEREADILSAYYVQGLTMRHIGTALDISEGRVSQLHAQAIAKLRAVVIGNEEKSRLLTPRWRAA
jgi:RNA polymerase sigma factor for flagellar operon FliA